MPHNKFKYWDKGFWVWRGTVFDFFFFKHLSTSLLFFYMCVYKKNTSHVSQQPINAVDTGNLSLHIPHALGSGEEQSLSATKSHFSIFASVPRSFSNFLVPVYCEEEPKSSLMWGDHCLRQHESFLMCCHSSSQVSTKCCVFRWAQM